MRQKLNISKMNEVKILVYDLSGIVKEEYKTSRENLVKLNIFQTWFNSCEFYQDYIEIGEGYSGLSNLMLFNKNETSSYLLTINCENYEHELGKYKPPIISDIIKYVENGELPSEKNRLAIVNKYL